MNWLREQLSSRRTRAVLVALSVALFGFLAVNFVLPEARTLEESWRVLEGMTWWLVLLAIGSQCLCYVCHGLVICGLQETLGQRLSLARGIAIVMASYSVSLLWGGQVTNSGVTYRWLRASGEPLEAAALTGVIQPLLNTVSFGVLSAIGLVFLLLLGNISTVLILTFGFALLLLCSAGFLVWWLVRHQNELMLLFDWLSRNWARFRGREPELEQSREAIGRLIAALNTFIRGRWHYALAGDFMSAVFDFLTLYLLFFAAGNSFDPVTALAGYGLPVLAGKLSILPGGLGVIEGGMAALYLTLGVPGEVVVVVVLGYRLLSFWVPVLLGFPLAVLLDRGVFTLPSAPSP